MIDTNKNQIDSTEKLSSGANIRYSECQVMRRKLITISKIVFGTGEEKDRKQKWVDEKCGSPLWSDEEQINGMCKSCKSGWTHEHNYRIDD